METQTHKHKVKFKVSLSNGETLFEGKDILEEIPNELSPWNKLIKYTADNHCEVTSLSLYTDDGQTFNLPSAGKNPKFRAFADAEKPIDFECYRKIANDLMVTPENGEYVARKHGTADWYTVIEAIYPKYRLQLWVDENNTKNCWVLVV